MALEFESRRTRSLTRSEPERQSAAALMWCCLLHLLSGVHLQSVPAAGWPRGRFESPARVLPYARLLNQCVLVRHGSGVTHGHGERSEEHTSELQSRENL